MTAAGTAGLAQTAPTAQAPAAPATDAESSMVAMAQSKGAWNMVAMGQVLLCPQSVVGR